MGTPPPISIATLSMPDTLILMVLALVVFGPRRLPKIGRQIGKLMYEFRKASNDFKFQMEEELRKSEEADRRKKEEEERQRALAAAPPPPQLEQSTSQAESIAAANSARNAEPPTLRTRKRPIPTQPRIPISPIEATRCRQRHTAIRSRSPLAPTTESCTPAAGSKPPRASCRPPPARLLPPNVPARSRSSRSFSLAMPAQTHESVTPEAERSEPAAHHG